MSFQHITDLRWKGTIRQNLQENEQRFCIMPIIKKYEELDEKLPEQILKINSSSLSFIDYDQNWDARLLGLIDLPDVFDVRIGKRKRLDLVDYLCISKGKKDELR